MSSTTEVFAAMKEAVTGEGGKSLQRKFKVGISLLLVLLDTYTFWQQTLHCSVLAIQHVTLWTQHFFWRLVHASLQPISSTHLLHYICNLMHEQGSAVFTVGDQVFSLNLSSPTSCNVSEGDAFDGKADLKVTCSEEVMGKMIRKEVQPQQGKQTSRSH